MQEDSYPWILLLLVLLSLVWKPYRTIYIYLLNFNCTNDNIYIYILDPSVVMITIFIYIYTSDSAIWEYWKELKTLCLIPIWNKFKFHIHLCRFNHTCIYKHSQVRKFPSSFSSSRWVVSIYAFENNIQSNEVGGWEVYITD